MEPAFDMHFEQVNQLAMEMDSIAIAILVGKSMPVRRGIGLDDVQMLLAINTAIVTGERVLLDPVIRPSATIETGGAINGAWFTTT